MCFSASASFGAATVIGIAGLVTLKKTKKPSQVLFACIPLLFSVQQFAEGFVWLSLTDKEYESWRNMATLSFLFFAQVVWPLLVPLSIYLIEKNNKRKQLLRILTGMGALMAGFLAWCLLSYSTTAIISSHHIDYSINYPVTLSLLSSAVYLTVTVLPPFISGNKKLLLLGILVLASFFITKLFYPAHIISIWCYFAALISVVVLYLVIDMNKPASAPKIN